MDNYILKSSQELPDSESQLSNFNETNKFVINNTSSNIELIKAYLTNPKNGLAIEQTIETNALIWAQGDCIDKCFELSDTLQTQLPHLTVTHDLRERTVVDIWEPKSDRLCSFRVTRKLPTIFIVLKMVLKCVRIVSDVSREPERQKRRDKRGSRKIELVLDDTVNIKKYNKK